MSDKTEQTIKVLLDQCKKIGYGDFEVKLIIYASELVGFEQTKPHLISYRAKKQEKKGSDEG